MKGKALTTEEFIKRARKVHGDTYDYSETLYKTSKIKVKIKCTKHGTFEQMPHSHLNGRKCSKCSFEQSRLTTEEFIERAKKIHGNNYNYSRTVYEAYNKNVIIGCPDHGWFDQKAGSHLKGGGCKICGNIIKGKKRRLSHDNFIKKANQIHFNRYDYSRVKYKTSEIKVIIGCPDHGWFDQKAGSHLKGAGCKKCFNKKLKKLKTLSKKEFIKRAKKIHNNKYDYSKTIYRSLQEKIIIGCPDHGWFEQPPSTHLVGCGCPICGKIEFSKKMTMSLEDFLIKAKKIHGNRYDYSKTEYNLGSKKVVITCKQHGDFEQNASKHLIGNQCPKCKNKAEGRIAEILLEKFIIFRGFQLNDEKKYFDFYLPDYNLIIERDGEQHYFDNGFFSDGRTDDYIKKQQENDRYKTELAKKHGYKIARIPYWLNDEQVEREIDNILADNPSYPDVPDLKQAETKPLPN